MFFDMLNNLTRVKVRKADSVTLAWSKIEMNRFVIIRFIAIFALLFAIHSAFGQDAESYEQPPINYSKATPSNSVSHLQSSMLQGWLRPGDGDREIVKTLLHKLNVPIESQVLVFSKTSLQRQRISPEQPRAIYFNDTCYLGWVPGGLIEVTAADPVLGPVFYTVNPATARTNPAECFVRDADCLRCHGGNFVRGIPGVFARSVFTDKEGEPLLRHGSEVVDYRTPFTNRWGGWYVTGKHGAVSHRGNVLAREENGQLLADFTRGANVTNLSAFFNTADYLADTSDIVALLVLEHQTAMQNALTQASLSCRKMLQYQKTLQTAFKEPLTEEPAYDSVKSVFDSTARELTDVLLFKDEAELPPVIEGAPGFQRVFLKTAVRTANGESLKDFHLAGHLFKNRCSYLIYSDAFLKLPGPLKRRIFDRLKHALRLKDPDSRYGYLEPAERARIVRILCETHPELRPKLAELLAETKRAS
jgi:hypothetical protein